MIWTIASIVDVAGPRHRLQFVLPQAHVQPYWTGDIVSITDVDWFQAHLDQYRRDPARAHDWDLNLLSNPNCSAQVGVLRYELAATTLTGQARQDNWGAMTRFWPAYLDYQARTDRTIPVVKLKILAVSGPGPDPGA